MTVFCRDCKHWIGNQGIHLQAFNFHNASCLDRKGERLLPTGLRQRREPHVDNANGDCPGFEPVQNEESSERFSLLGWFRG